MLRKTLDAAKNQIKAREKAGGGFAPRILAESARAIYEFAM
jgi:hypothetical protein